MVIEASSKQDVYVSTLNEKVESLTPGRTSAELLRGCHMSRYQTGFVEVCGLPEYAALVPSPVIPASFSCYVRGALDLKKHY